MCDFMFFRNGSIIVIHTVKIRGSSPYVISVQVSQALTEGLLETNGIVYIDNMTLSAIETPLLIVQTPDAGEVKGKYLQ